MSSKLEDPVFIEYWRLQGLLRKAYEGICGRCPTEPRCWPLDGACYDAVFILGNCKRPAVRKVVARLKALLDERDALYFAATAEELSALEEAGVL